MRLFAATTIIRMIGVAGSVSGLYYHLNRGMPLMDFALIALISLLLITAAGKRKDERSAEDKIEINVPVEEMERGFLIRSADAPAVAPV